MLLFEYCTTSEILSHVKIWFINSLYDEDPESSNDLSKVSCSESSRAGMGRPLLTPRQKSHS